MHMRHGVRGTLGVAWRALDAFAAASFSAFAWSAAAFFAAASWAAAALASAAFAAAASFAALSEATFSAAPVQHRGAEARTGHRRRLAAGGVQQAGGGFRRWRRGRLIHSIRLREIRKVGDYSPKTIGSPDFPCDCHDGVRRVPELA